MKLGSTVLGQVLLQRQTGPLTRQMGCARLSHPKYKPCDVSAEESKPVDGVGECATIGCVCVQEFLSFVINHFGPHNPIADRPACHYPFRALGRPALSSICR